MDLKLFRSRFSDDVLFKKNSLDKISNIEGTNSPLIQHTINLAVSCLKGTTEAYLEVGCLNGASLEAASKKNEEVNKYACDIEIQGEMPRLIKEIPNLEFAHDDFFSIDLETWITDPIGVYYYDANHDHGPTYQALKEIVPYLADKAIIFMDDIDGYSRVYNGWRKFMRKHSDQFMVVHEFWTPDRFRACTVGYSDGWWNGFAVAEFERYPEQRDESIESIAISRYHGIGKYANKPKVIYPAELKHIHGKEEIKI